VLPGSNTTQTVPIRNHSHSPLSVKTLVKSCSCLDIGLDSDVLLPRKAVDLTVTLATPTYRSRFEHTVTVQYREKIPPTTVKFVGTVGAWIFPDTSAVEFGEVAAGQVARQTVSFQVGAAWPKSQSDITCTMPHTRIEKVTVDKTEKRYSCTICFEPPANIVASDFEGDLRLQWTGFEGRRLNLLCRAKVVPDWTAEPAAIIVGKIAQGQRATFSTLIRHRRINADSAQQRFKLVIEPSGAVNASFRSDESGLHVSGTVFENEPSKAGLRYAELALQGPDDKELLRIPIYWEPLTQSGDLR